MSREWWKLAAVGVVAVVLAGIGSVVATRVSPPPTSQPVAASLASTPSTTEPAPTTTAVAPSTTPPEPAALELSDSVVDFGDSSDTASFEFTNSGGTAASWTITAPDGSVSVTPAAGEIVPGQVQTISVALDRTTVSEGELGTILTLGWDNNELQILAQGVHADNPIIIGPKATPSTVLVQTGSACDPAQTTITVRIKDSSDLAEVLVRWSSGSDGATVEASMNAVDEENYQAVIGPFSSVGSPDVKIVATDVHDNAGGAPVALTVVACP